VRPGWSNASITELAEQMAERASDDLYRDLAGEFPHLDDRTWTILAGMLDMLANEPEYAKQYSMAERRQLAKSGKAMPDGSYPVVTVGDLMNAMQAFGRAPESKRGRLKSFLARRANALGVADDVKKRIAALDA
jgi:hypothetical protein